MSLDTSELAENKLLLLYILKKIDMPVTNAFITQIVLENNLINYFSLQQYLSELISSAMIKDSKDDRTHELSLTKLGNDTLTFFPERIPKKKKEIIDEYLEVHLIGIKNELEITGEYEPVSDNNFMVYLKLHGNKGPLIEIKLPASSNNEAKEICSNWKANSSSYYPIIIELLKKKKES